MWTLLAGLLTLPVYADADADLAQLDAGIRQLDSVSISGDPAAMTLALKAAVQQYGALRELAGQSAQDAPADHRARLAMRMGEAGVGLVHALSQSSCPSGLVPEQCEIYNGAVAEKAQVLLHPAADATARARQHADLLERKERKRLAGLEKRLSDLSATIEARLPPPRRRVAQQKTPSPAAPRQLGAPGALPPGWVVAPPSAPYGEALTPDPSNDFVQVDKTAWLSSNQDGTGQRARMWSAPPDTGPATPMLARLVETDGDRALLELGPGDRRLHCFADSPMGDAWRVRMWADVGALQRVTAQPFEQSFDDGSSLKLRPGALVTADGVWADGLLLPVQPPDSVVADRYRETAAVDSEAESVDWVDGGATLSVGGRPVVLAAAGPGDPPGQPVHATATGPEGTELVTFQSSCGQIIVAVTGRDPDAPDGTSGLFGALRGRVGTEPRVVLRGGTPLVWPNGSPAGVLLEDRTFLASEVPQNDAGQWCMQREIGWFGEVSPDRNITLCVATVE